MYQRYIKDKKEAVESTFELNLEYTFTASFLYKIKNIYLVRIIKYESLSLSSQELLLLFQNVLPEYLSGNVLYFSVPEP